MDPAIGSIILLLICCIAFVFEPWPSWVIAMVGCLLAVILKFCTWSQAFAGFSNSTTFLLIGMFILGNAMFESGAARLTGEKAIKLSRGNSKALLGIGMALACVMSAFLSNTAVTATMLAVMGCASAASKSIEIKDLFMPMSIAAMAGGVCTLVGSTPQATAQGLLTGAGFEGFAVFDYAYVGIPMCIILILYSLFISLPLGKKIWGNRYDEDVDETYSKENLEKLKAFTYDKRKVITAFIIFGITIVLFITNIFSTGVTCMLSGLACIMTGCIKPKVALQKMNWSMIFRYAATLGFCKAVEVTGGGDLIANGIIKAFGDMLTPYVLFCVVVALGMLMSNFMANSTPIAILFPILLSLQASMNLNIYAYVMGITVAANLAFCTPIGNAQSTMALAAGYRFGDYVKWGGILEVFILIGICMITPVFFQLTV